MVNSQKVVGLVWRPPSLKGHSIQRRLQNRHGAKVYEALNRHSLMSSIVYLPNPARTSIVGLINLLEQSGGDFQALRLRNGDLCCLADAGGELHDANSGELLKSRHPRTLQRIIAVLLTLAFSLLAYAFWSTELSQGASAPSPVVLSAAPILDCSSLLDSSYEESVAYLEKGSASANYGFETLSTLQNGGLRSVVIKVTCASELFSSEDQESSQEWRSTLRISDLSWVVTKMTRLDN